MKPIYIVINTTPADYIWAAILFKQLGLLLSAKIKSQIRILGVHHDSEQAATYPGARVQVNGLAVPPEPGFILDEVRRQLHINSRRPPAHAAAA